MTKYKALLFRELRISRKNNILKAMVLLICALFYGAAMYTIKNEVETETVTVLSMAVSCSLMLGLLAVILNLLQNDTFKSDLNTNWLAYSYTLPIRAQERAWVNIVQRCGLTVLSLLTGLVITGIYCRIGDIAFSVGFVAMYAAVFACAQLSALLTDSFLYRARSIGEFHRQNQRAALTLLGIYVVLGIVLIRKFGNYFASDEGLPLYRLLEILDARALALLLMLDVALVVADFFFIRNRLQYASSSLDVRTEGRVQAKETISDTHAYPTGFLYKELRQNRRIIGLIAAFPFVTLAVNYLTVFTMGLMDNLRFRQALLNSDYTIFRYIYIAIGAFFVSTLLSGIFGGDNRKLWAYFTVSTPQGVKGSLYSKYVLVFALNGLYMAASVFANTLYDTICFAVTGEEIGSINMLARVLFFLLLAICAFDIPFMIRFGPKMGGYIKVSLMLGIAAVAIIGFAFLPEHVAERIMQGFQDILEGRAGDGITLAVSVSPGLCMAAYLLSYRFSCRLFMKGVDSYDK